MTTSRSSLSLGRLVPRKGVETVIQSVALLRCLHGVRARLLVAGGQDPGAGTVDTEACRLRHIAEGLGIGESVVFCGPQPRDMLHRYYAAADIFVTAPWYEPFGMTPLEAMACGRPVIGTDVGGIKSTIEHGVTGWLVPPKDPDALAVRLAALLRNPDLASSMGEAGLARARAAYTWQSVAERVTDVYHDVVDGAARARQGLALRQSLVRCSFDGAIDALRASRDELAPGIVRLAQAIATAFEQGNKVLVCGNGGSAADAQHFATELVGRFKIAGRRALPVIALTADSAVLTAWANDTGYDDVFARQVLALGNPGDLLLGITTSGNSKNVLAAFSAARDSGLRCIALTGGSGGQAARFADDVLAAGSRDTQHIQEVHSVIIHVLCELIESAIAGEGIAPTRTLAAAGARS